MQNLLASAPLTVSLIVTTVLLAIACLITVIAWHRLREASNGITHERDLLKADYQETKQALALSSQELSQVQAHSGELKSTNSALQSAISEQEERAITLRESNAQLAAAEKSLTETSARLTGDLSQSKTSNQNLATEVEALKTERSQRREELSTLTERLTTRETEVSQFQKHTAELKETNHALTTEVENLNGAGAEQREQLSTLTERLSAREVELVETKNAIEEHQLAHQESSELLAQTSKSLHQKEVELAEALTELLSRDEKVTEYSKAVASLQKKIVTLQEDNEMYQKDIADQEKDFEISQNKLEAQEEKLDELKSEFERQKSSLKDEFKVLSESILKKRQDSLDKSSTTGITNLLAPLKEEISGFKKRVETVHSESQSGQGQLKEQLKNLRDMNSQLTERAENLTNALRNDKKTLGNWGEIQVERLLENAGFDRTNYRREANFKTTEGANQRPDFIIDLPEEKCLIIDSKVTLNAYVDSVNAKTEEERLAFLKQHTTNIRNHIKALSSKNYDSLEELKSPDFIFMFMPVESAYLAAFEEDASLFDFAYDKKVAVVTPNTLLPILKTVQSLWRIDRQNKSTEALAESAGKVHKKLMTFLEKFVDVEKKIDSLQSSFSQAKGVLNTGKGNLVRLAENFEEQGVKITKNTPIALKSIV